MVRVMNYFETQVRVPLESNRARPGRPKGVLERSAEIASMHMSDLEKARWYGQILENVRLRYRKLQRFARYVMSTFPFENHSNPSSATSLRGLAMLQSTSCIKK